MPEKLTVVLVLQLLILMALLALIYYVDDAFVRFSRYCFNTDNPTPTTNFTINKKVPLPDFIKDR